MKLSELLYLKENINKVVSENQPTLSWDNFVEATHNVLPDQIPGSVIESLTNENIAVQQSIKNFFNILDTYTKNLSNDCRRLEPEYFQASKNIYEELLQADKIALYEHKLSNIFRTKANLDEEDIQLFEGRLKSHSRWITPGLIIRPAYDDYIQCMVSSDPLYLVDTDKLLLQPALNKFNQHYQRRLRTYVYNEQDSVFFHELPVAQMGFIWVYNLFAFRPINIIEKYLTEIFLLLRAGGMVAFTINDGDNWQAVELTEQNVSCYTPLRYLRQFWKNLGFVETFEYKSKKEFTYIELTKPGQMTSLRGGQSYATIIPIH